MPLGNEELREDGRTGTPDLGAAPGIIEATVVAEGPATPEVPDVPDVPEVPDGLDVVDVPEVPDGLDVVDLRTTPDVPHVPLWGPRSRDGAVALWEQAPAADGDRKDASVEPVPVASTAVEPAPLDPRGDEPRHRRIALVGVALAGAMLLLGVVAVTGWPGTEGTDSVANRLGPDGPGPTLHDGSPADLPPSQPATAVSFEPSGEVVRPEPRRARIVDPQSGEEVVVTLPPGTRVDAATGQVVVRVTGTPTSISTSTTRASTTTTAHASTTSTTESTTTTTESTTTTTEDTTTTTEDTTTTIETVP